MSALCITGATIFQFYNSAIKAAKAQKSYFIARGFQFYNSAIKACDTHTVACHCSLISILQ